MIERTIRRKAKIAIFAVVHGIYFEQFPGLYESLSKLHEDLCEKIRSNDGVELVDFGMVDSSEKGYETAEKIKAANVNLIFCNMITYATSSVFAPILQSADVPMVLVALQPRKAMDYTQANTFMQLENDSICSVPEFCMVAERYGKPVNDVIIGTLYDDEKADKEINK